MDSNRIQVLAIVVWITAFFCPLSIAADPSPSSNGVITPSQVYRNDLDGLIQGQVDFAQTHVIGAQRAIFDPLLVPGREVLVMFTPSPLQLTQSVSMVLHSGEQDFVFAMAPPSLFPTSATFDQSNTFSGKPIVGEYPKFRDRAFTSTMPGYLFSPASSLKFFINGNSSVVGSLNRNKTLFLNNESEGLVLMNIKGCIFKEQTSCRTTLDQWDMQKNPELAKIAAREMFSELPVKQLVLGMGQSYWPYVIARGPDGKPHRYSTSDRDYHEWAEFGDKTLPAKVGMGNFWRAASDLGDKQPGKFVAISGQLLDAPDDIPLFPEGVGASCGGSSCNYPSYPAGFWHETGHGLGLPHDTPPRYEQWGYRSYDLRFLPNYHPAPHNYGLGVDYLGYHYFGHVMGALTEPAWPNATASAPLVDEFERLRSVWPGSVADWKHYIAPYTHQQMLRVQQRFGSFPEGLEYAEITDDHRPPPTAAPAIGNGVVKTSAPLIDTGIDTAIPDTGKMLKLIHPGELPTQGGVPVQTLVITMSSAVNDPEKISQIYPPIASNYGNVFAPTATRSHAGEKQVSASFEHMKIQSSKTGKCLAVLSAGTVGFEVCQSSLDSQQWSQRGSSTFLLVNSGSGNCLDGNLQIVNCVVAPAKMWGLRRDLTNSDTIIRLQDTVVGKFITASSEDSISMEGIGGAEQVYYLLSGDTPPSDVFVLEVKYASGTIEEWPLFPGTIDVDDIITASINVAALRDPSVAELKRNGQIVDTRALDHAPGFPPAIIVGGNAGYPIVLPQYLRSKSTGLCLARTNTGLTQQACKAWDRQQEWGFFDVVSAAGRNFALTGSSTASCLNTDLTLTTCWSEQLSLQWSGRKDLAPAGLTKLQSAINGMFITAVADGTVSLQALTQDADQDFTPLVMGELSE
ncbi:TagA domain-containing protein [Pseudomonas sp. G.S.17]|uniref:TagA domain-containing protein n=1 Tax=Pseudomonas sp. G.S.17 TaxID=3137451 RepID=UPI00311CD7BF